MKPQRIQLSRRKGFRMPENTVKADRTSRLFGNPYRVGVDGSAAQCVELFRAMVGSNIWSEPNTDTIKERLRGKNLACWCKLCPAHKDGLPMGVECPDCAPCHVDVLLEIANQP